MVNSLDLIIYAWTHKARAGDIDSALVEYITIMAGGVSFVEIVCDFANFIPVSGDQMLPIAHKNVVLWGDLSPILADTLTSLLEQERIHWLPCSPLVYLLDGKTMTLPITDCIPEVAYKTPHWLPATLEPGKPPVVDGEKDIWVDSATVVRLPHPG